MFNLSGLFSRKQRHALPASAPQPTATVDPVLGLTVLLNWHTARAAHYEKIYRANPLDDQACAYWSHSALAAARIADQLGVMTQPAQLPLF
jgi:hypothetical protein